MVETNERDPAQRMAALFGGTRMVSYDPKKMLPPDENGKVKPDPEGISVERKLTAAMFRQHLDGRRCLGVIDGTYGVIDWDSYGGREKAFALCRRAQEDGLPLVPCLSKSRGVHLFLFHEPGIGSDLVKRALARMAALLDLKLKEAGGDTELLCGSNVWLPGCGAAMKETMPETNCALNAWIENAEERVVSRDDLLDIVAEREPGDGETRAQAVLDKLCQQLAAMEDGEGRNNYLNGALFHMGTMVGAGWIDNKTVKDAFRNASQECGLGKEGNELIDRAGGPLDKGMKTPPKTRTRAPAVANVVCVADVPPKPVDWLWPSRIALGKLTLVGGPPGVSKSTLTCDIAARITRGLAWPMNEGQAPLGSVVMISTEDDIADTIRPRLAAAGADVSRVHVLQGITENKKRRTFDLTLDAEALQAVVASIGDVKAVIIDPITAYQGRPGGRQDTYRPSDVRAMLEPFQELAARLGFALIVITHLTKADGGGGALNRILGSISMAASARAVYIVAREPLDDDEEDDEPPDPRFARILFLPAKNNIGDDWRGFAFTRQECDTGYAAVPTSVAVAWEDGYEYTRADDVLKPPKKQSDGRRSESAERAVKIIRDLLEDGPVPAKAMEKQLDAMGISEMSGKTAKRKLGVRSERQGNSFVWVLPGFERRELPFEPGEPGV